MSSKDLTPLCCMCLMMLCRFCLNSGTGTCCLALHAPDKWAQLLGQKLLNACQMVQQLSPLQSTKERVHLGQAAAPLP